MAGLAYFLGLRRIGATAIRGGSGSIAALEELTVRNRPSVIVGVPTLLLNLAQRLEASGTAPQGLGVERLVCIGEPVRNADLSLSRLGARLESEWGARVYGTYASTEMATAFCDCAAGNGGHLHPDLIVLEAIDEDGRPVLPGEPGELVATPLQVTGMPLLRFRTGDIARVHVEPCPCRRTSARVGPIIGRKSQMLKYRGTTVYPAAIFAVLQEMQGINGYYLEVYDDFELSDRIRVVLGSQDPEIRSDHVAEALAARLRVKPEVVVASPEAVQAKTTEPGKRKPVIFFDHRRANLA
jgi:phenylacetate-CoA ligase